MKIYTYPSQAAEKKVALIANRGLAYKKKDLLAVTRILEDVRKNGDAALIKYVNRFDAPAMRLDALQVTSEEMSEARSAPSVPALDRHEIATSECQRRGELSRTNRARGASGGGEEVAGEPVAEGGQDAPVTGVREDARRRNHEEEGLGRAAHPDKCVDHGPWRGEDERIDVAPDLETTSCREPQPLSAAPPAAGSQPLRR